MPQRRGCCARMKSWFSCLMTITFMTVAAVFLWYFLGYDADDAKELIETIKDGISNFDFGNFTDVLDDITDRNWGDFYGNEDPFVGDNTTNAWATEGKGLTLELQNALDEFWQEEFQEAVADWQESEVLTLTTKRVAVDHSCGRIDGVMLVCNGNFGDTGWVGLNEVEISYRRLGGPGFIVSSVAKMNEYYLNKAPYAKRLYTMCHEIGHGFGLPHTDENPNNRDLGNCLDYTSAPENNLRPGESNFQRLRSVYLEGGRNRQLYLEDSVSAHEERDEQDNLRRVVITRYLYE